MRVTNTMLKQASLSSGLPLAHSTLLDHLNNDRVMILWRMHLSQEIR